jgi:hypothetical protein
MSFLKAPFQLRLKDLDSLILAKVDELLAKSDVILTISIIMHLKGETKNNILFIISSFYHLRGINGIWALGKY